MKTADLIQLAWAEESGRHSRYSRRFDHLSGREGRRGNRLGRAFLDDCHGGVDLTCGHPLRRAMHFANGAALRDA